jgi:plastocyanin
MIRVPIIAMMCALSAGTSAADSLAGKVTTRVRPGLEASAAIVYATPVGSPAAPSKAGRFTIAQKDKTFVPRVLVITAGSTVDFPNTDPIFHNVFSLSTPAPFDLGLYRAGASKTRVFAEPGTYRVFCNIHPQMTSLLAVVPSPYFTIAERGAYRLDVPPGAYRLTVFSERGTPVMTDVRVPAGGVTVPDVTLDESAFQQTNHTNKFGQPYSKDAYRIK